VIVFIPEGILGLLRRKEEKIDRLVPRK